ncbi:hypothetical protein GMORB2_3989 [Geosmithia morbida]|uniref:Uncharacterized protein n=1 Tax=Geosmithia morbida TaxID=1094350 RepID=A0A9P5D6V4_9HYPO|nr:uncharacterized protein GMORB2_3989 [Geosmithia morbida]KAF4125150.1 hypothetical protein GMORB2_3989 [Geosmithia morbida]
MKKIFKSPMPPFNMTGTPTYRPAEIQFILHSLVRRVKHSQIRHDFEHMFRRRLAPNQIRYVKNKYGRDSRYKRRLAPNQIRYVKNKYGRDSRYNSVMVNYRGRHAVDLEEALGRPRPPPPTIAPDPAASVLAGPEPHSHSVRHQWIDRSTELSPHGLYSPQQLMNGCASLPLPAPLPLPPTDFSALPRDTVTPVADASADVDHPRSRPQYVDQDQDPGWSSAEPSLNGGSAKMTPSVSPGTTLSPPVEDTGTPPGFDDPMHAAIHMSVAVNGAATGLGPGQYYDTRLLSDSGPYSNPDLSAISAHDAGYLEPAAFASEPLLDHHHHPPHSPPPVLMSVEQDALDDVEVMFFRQTAAVGSLRDEDYLASTGPVLGPVPGFDVPPRDFWDYYSPVPNVGPVEPHVSLGDDPVGTPSGSGIANCGLGLVNLPADIYARDDGTRRQPRDDAPLVATTRSGHSGAGAGAGPVEDPPTRQADAAPDTQKPYTDIYSPFFPYTYMPDDTYGPGAFHVRPGPAGPWGFTGPHVPTYDDPAAARPTRVDPADHEPANFPSEQHRLDDEYYEEPGRFPRPCDALLTSPPPIINYNSPLEDVDGD